MNARPSKSIPIRNPGLILLAVLLFSGCTTVVSIKGAPKEVRPYLVEAKALEKEGSYLEAVDKYHQAVTLSYGALIIEPEKYNGVNKRIGWCYYHQGLAEWKKENYAASESYLRHSAYLGNKQASNFLLKHFTPAKP